MTNLKRCSIFLMVMSGLFWVAAIVLAFVAPERGNIGGPFQGMGFLLIVCAVIIGGIADDQRDK